MSGRKAGLGARELLGDMDDDDLMFGRSSARSKKKHLFEKAAPKKRKISAYVREDLADRLKFTVAGLQGQGLAVDTGSLIEMALSAFLTDIELEYNEGEAFPAAEPRRGRPRK